MIRSLGRAGIRVTATTKERRSVFARSRHLFSLLEMPDKEQVGLWAESLNRHLRNYQYDLVIPTDDFTTIVLVENRAELSALSLLALPPTEAWLATYHKDRTYALAEKLNVPCPRNFSITTVSEVKALADRMSYPAVIKPLSSKIPQGGSLRWVRQDYARAADELVGKATDMLRIAPVSVQEFCSGVGLGQGFLMDRGNVRAVFQYERVHEPPTGGPSSYRKSVPVDERIYAYSTRLLKAIQWTGVAMVEYKYDQARNKVDLMEINGRFWGSLPLALAAGVDFPLLLYNMLVNHSEEKVFSYRSGVYCRKIQEDIGWLLDKARGRHAGSCAITVPWYRVVGESKALVCGKEHFDEIVVGDPLPAIMFVLQCVAALSRKLVRTLIEKLFCGLVAVRAFQLFEWIRLSRLLRRVGKQGHLRVLFVCRGNICRSPFAAALLKRCLKERNISSVLVISAGFTAEEGRPAPPYATDVARQYEVDLSQHLSSHVTAEDLDTCSVVFCMDLPTYSAALEKGKQYWKKTFLLGAVRNHTTEIMIGDPYKGDREDFVRAYRRVGLSVQRLVDEIQECFLS